MGGTSFSVRTDDLVAALKRLKLHQKRWRKLDILIRAGAGVGEIILEFSGDSRFAGMLTTMQGEGAWTSDVRIQASSLRGFVLHPPGEEQLEITIVDDRFHIGRWNCPIYPSE